MYFVGLVGLTWITWTFCFVNLQTISKPSIDVKSNIGMGWGWYQSIQDCQQWSWSTLMVEPQNPTIPCGVNTNMPMPPLVEKFLIHCALPSH